MDKRLFEKFYHANIDRIYRYVFFRIGRNRDVCEDLVSEIFIKALQHFDRYDPAISKSAWIYQIAHHHLANYFRDRKETVDLDNVQFHGSKADAEEVVIRHEEQIRLDSALDQLSAFERRIVTMKYIEGYSYKDMSLILGKSADALKVAAHRAVKKLKRLLYSSPYVASPSSTETISKSGKSDS